MGKLTIFAVKQSLVLCVLADFSFLEDFFMILSSVKSASVLRGRSVTQV